MNRLNLRQRLLLLSLLPSAVIAITLVSYFTLSGIRTLEGELRAKGLSTVRYLAQVSEYGIIAGQMESLHGLAQTTIDEPAVKAAIIVNAKGRAIAVSGRVSLAGETLRQALTSPAMVDETERWIGYGAPVMRTQNESDALFEPVSSTSPAAPEVIGRVFVEFDKSELLSRQHDLLLRGLVIVFIGLVFIALLAIAMADSLARPLKRLVQAVREMSAGQFDTRVPIHSSAELGILEQGFNEMAGHIEEVHRSMQTRIEEATAQLAFQARHDALTGLLNRREFEHRLEKALSGVQAGGEDFSVLLLDLDRFKPVNDTCGHLAGDELLRQISQLFQGRLREEDTLARLGGDEFGIILVNCSGQRARQVADDICGLASAYRFIWQDKVFAIGASIGLTPVNRRVRNINEILAAGDAACYRAKERGRHQVCEQETSNVPERRQETQNWAARITEAMAEHRLQIEAVPLRPLQDSTPAGHWVELTARLHEPGQPPIAWSALLDAAERYDLAAGIDRFFIETAIAGLERARQEHKELHCLVPLSRTSLGRRELIDFIAEQLAARALPGSGLCLFFSEDVSTHHSSQAAEFARLARALGCQIGLDDFGGSLSSFSHLHGIAPICVKLSRSLTRDLGGSRASTALLRAVQEITADLDIHTVADNVNDRKTLARLKELGISYAQGPAVAPAEPFEVWLEGAVIRAA
ncbi:MAG: diguanylate cyclase [Bacteroidota bacterium]